MTHPALRRPPARRLLPGRWLPACLSIACVLAGAAWSAQMDEAQRLLDEQRARTRSQGLSPPAIRFEAGPAADGDIDPAAWAEEEPAFDIQRIELAGDRLLEPGEAAALVQPFIGLRLGPKRINLLLRRLSAALIDRGYVTSRAYIGPQNLASGVLTVTLVAGRIEAVRIDGQAAGGGAWAALPFRPGQVLRLADLEQGVDQINRLRGYRAGIAILPGEAPGGSVIDLKREVRDRWRVVLGADNAGQKSTGSVRGRVQLEADDPLGLFDAWTLTHIQSRDAKASALAVSVPWGYSTLSYTYTTSEYTSPIPGVAVIAGDSSNHSIGLNRVLARDAVSKTAVDLSLTRRRAQARVHDEVRADIIRADALALAATLTRDLVAPIVRLNLGEDAPLPRLELRVDEPEDLAALADQVQKLVAVGLPVPQAWVRERWGIPEAAEGEAVLGASAAPPDQSAAQAQRVARNACTCAACTAAHAAGDPGEDVTPIDPQTDRMDIEAAPAWTGIMDRIKALVDGADSLEALRDGLLSAFGDLPAEQLAEVMAMGFAAAELAGRFDAREESEHG